MGFRNLAFRIGFIVAFTFTLTACTDGFRDHCRALGGFVKSSDVIGVTGGGNVAVVTIRYCIVPAKGVVDIE